MPGLPVSPFADAAEGSVGAIVPALPFAAPFPHSLPPLLGEPRTTPEDLSYGQQNARCDDAQHHQALRPGAGQRQGLAEHLPGRDPGTARRERQRQDHADEHALRHLLPGRGRDRHRRQGGRDPLAEGRLRPRHRHDPPAFQAGRRADRRGKHRARPARPAGSEGRKREDPRHLRSLRLRGRPEPEDLQHVRQPEADRGDREGPLPRGGYPDPRRAHRRADPAGERQALRGAAQHAQRRQGHRHHHPQDARGRGPVRPRGRAAPGAVHRRYADQNDQRPGDDQHDGGPSRGAEH